MARFSFHIRDGGNVIADEEGLGLADLEAVKFEAEASARDLLSAAATGESIGTRLSRRRMRPAVSLRRCA
jgi:hypothetical protein